MKLLGVILLGAFYALFLVGYFKPELTKYNNPDTWCLFVICLLLFLLLLFKVANKK